MPEIHVQQSNGNKTAINSAEKGELCDRFNTEQLSLIGVHLSDITRSSPMIYTQIREAIGIVDYNRHDNHPHRVEHWIGH